MQNILVWFKVYGTLGIGFWRNQFTDLDHPGAQGHYHLLVIMATYLKHLLVLLYKIKNLDTPQKDVFPTANGDIFAQKCLNYTEIAFTVNIFFAE